MECEKPDTILQNTYFAAQVAEQYDLLLRSLGDDTLSQVARWKMEGFTNDEIAQKIGCVTRTVERKLELIRDRWQAVFAE